MRRAYIATPITGVPQQNRPMVDRIAAYLQRFGHAPVVPHDIEPYEHEGDCPEPEYAGVTGDASHTGLCYLRADIAELTRCDLVVMAPGWSRSRGATAERTVARLLGIPVRYWSTELGQVWHEPEPVDLRNIALDAMGRQF